jgi:hypothetical protein
MAVSAIKDMATPKKCAGEAWLGEQPASWAGDHRFEVVELTDQRMADAARSRPLCEFSLISAEIGVQNSDIGRQFRSPSDEQPAHANVPECRRPFRTSK